MMNTNAISQSPVTSADACLSIVHSLLCHRQGGESESFSKRAIESLVKKLKDKRDELDALIMSITSGGTQASKCVTIPRTLDGRLQVAGRKGFPHVIYAKIWRWPDLHKNELKHVAVCQYAFDLKCDAICVNPYHYQRIPATSIDLSSLSLGSVDSCGDGFGVSASSHEQSNSAVGVIGMHIPQSVHSMMSPCLPTHVPAASHQGIWPPPVAPAPLSSHQTWPSHHSSAVVHSAATTATHHQMQQMTVPQQHPPISRAPAVVHQTAPQQQVPLTVQRPPEHWCTITYYELDQPVGEIFKVPYRLGSVTIDGYTDPSSPCRFCLGQLSNVHRSDQSDKARLHIGKGVMLDHVAEGDVWLRCLSDHSVFVQSYYLDREAGRAPGEAVHKIYQNAYIKVFDIRQAHEHMRAQAAAARQATVSQAAAVAGHMQGGASGQPVQPNLMGGTAGLSVDELRKGTVLKLSFVKGWGPDYPRGSIKETPCWVELQLCRPLQLLDEVLQSMPLNDLKPTRHFLRQYENASQVAAGVQVSNVSGPSGSGAHPASGMHSPSLAQIQVPSSMNSLAALQQMQAQVGTGVVPRPLAHMAMLHGQPLLRPLGPHNA